MASATECSHRRHQKNTKRKNNCPNLPRLDIHRSTDSEDGLLGEISLPGVLDASVVLAGSRKKLQEILHIATDSIASEPEAMSDVDGLLIESSDDFQHRDDGVTEQQLQENTEELRSNNFEKNTFRQPKFWLFWRGRILVPSTSFDATGDQSPPDPIQSGMGYVVFTGNKYQKFNGTISCDILGCDNFAQNGWKR
ncbi:catalase [Fusarium beomiforme]|uniref:Catalase n=1 Tax=Fusarium beomiforme TaxID=44412 RepID=A0A9P5E284_9HYPO|nr:catalase [Fusarium beomiforme]